MVLVEDVPGPVSIGAVSQHIYDSSSSARQAEAENGGRVAFTLF